ncbi:alpha/beta hydrolase [Streptomyces sp. NPDC007856]|uniref:alpha/beta hydrolase n=1 Tax=Streptomyces sp. NPDC007856 TaxID=3364781 RepID=UPI003676E94E
MADVRGEARRRAHRAGYRAAAALGRAHDPWSGGQFAQRDAGDADPYCAEGAQRRYAEPLGLPADIIPGAAHLDLDAGYGPWPAALEWCLSGTTPLVARPEPGM